MAYTLTGRTLTLDPFELEDLNEALRDAYNLSSAVHGHIEVICSVKPGAVGDVEGWFGHGELEPLATARTNFYTTDTGRYRIIVSDKRSPFINLHIPGVLELLNRNALAVSRDYDEHIASLTRTVFNTDRGTLRWRTAPGDLVVRYRPEWGQIEVVAQRLGIPPPVPTTYNISEVLVSIFGEKIASVIVKEIK